MSSPAVPPSHPRSLGAQKLAQAQSFLAPAELDAWLIVVRESGDRPDPALHYFLDQDFIWTSYFLVMPDRCVALVATLDSPDLVSSGLFAEVRTYREGPRAALRGLLEEFDPRRIGINVSLHDALADGLTAGLRDALVESLQGTPFAGRLTSAEALVGRLRAVKLPQEQSLIRRAVEETESMFDAVARELRTGMTAREIAASFHRLADRAGARTSWARRHCPTVTVGAAAAVGHVSPGEERVTHGCLVHVDFGIARGGYCSDLQRTWYVTSKERREAPEPVRAAYAAIVEAIELGGRALRPGTAGWEVDRAARSHLVEKGYPEYAHALGHHVGRAVHDGGGVLGPQWERYGNEPFQKVEEGHVYTLEPSIQLPGHGVVSLEEDVVVGAHGVEFLSRFPRTLPLLPLD